MAKGEWCLGPGLERPIEVIRSEKWRTELRRVSCSLCTPAAESVVNDVRERVKWNE